MLCLGQHERAIECFSEALEIEREVGDRASEGLILGNLGLAFHAQGQHAQALACYMQALDLHREVGDRRSEAINLGNLGDAQFRFGRLAEAETAFRQAIPIGDEVFPASAGAFRGSLALLLARQGRQDEVQGLLEAGEVQVTSHPAEHAKFLCKKGQILHLAGDATAAAIALAEVESIAAELAANPDSELGQVLAETREILTR